MKTKVLVVLLLLCCAACRLDQQTFERMMKQEGISQAVDDGMVLYGCADDDFYQEKFHGIKNGVPVSGIICGGGNYGKGMTVRYR